MRKPPPCIIVIRCLATATLLLSLSSNLSPSRAEPVSGSSVLFAAVLFTQLLSQLANSQLHGADLTALGVLQNHEQLRRLRKNTDRLSSQLSLIHRRINLLPEQFDKSTELQFDLNAQDHFYSVIKTLTDEMSASEQDLQPDIPIYLRLHDLEVARNRLMQRSFLNTPAIIYGWIYEIAYRKEQAQSQDRLSHVNQIYRQWLLASVDSDNPDSLPSMLNSWRSRRIDYQYRLATNIEHLVSIIGGLRPYYIPKPPRPENCNVWLFCNSSESGKKYHRWPNTLEPLDHTWLYPYLSHDASSYRYPGSCSRDKHDTYYMTIARCDWTINHDVNAFIFQVVEDATEQNVEVLPLIELYYEALLWEFMISELIRQVNATLSDRTFQPKNADFATADYDVGCDSLKQDIASCWQESLRELKQWQKTDATAWAYTYRCVQHIKTWNLLAGPFPYSRATSTAGPCRTFNDTLDELFAARNFSYLRSIRKSTK